MAYYVRHFFNPDFSHERLRPKSLKDGNVNQHYLGYVHNVVAGQVLAEVINLEEQPDFPVEDPQFVFPERVFPCGPNCEPHPDFPERILARINGYVFYHQGLITVKGLLNVRRSVDFHTGNILFVGDIVAHDAVRTGFTLMGNNVLVKGTIEGASIIAAQDIVCESGIKGVSQGLLRCGGNVKVPFCENMRIHALGNVEIEGSCLHSEIYAGGSLMIKGRLQGGSAYVRDIIYVTEQVGGGQNTATKVTLGYPPDKLHTLHILQDERTRLREQLTALEGQMRKKPEMAEHDYPLICLNREKLRLKKAWLARQSEEIKQESQASTCRLVCPGTVKPGLEISIAQAYTEVRDFYQRVEFRLENNTVVCNPLNK